MLSCRPSSRRAGVLLGENRERMLSRTWRDMNEEGDASEGLLEEE